MSELSPDLQRDHRIDQQEAVDLVHRYQASGPPRSHLATAYNLSAFTILLGQPGCEGIRIYRALHEDATPTLVMVGVDAQGRDLAEDTHAFIQAGQNCPPVCFWESIFHAAETPCGLSQEARVSLEFDVHRDHRISKERITGLVKAFQSQARPDELHASMYHRSAFEYVLDQLGCAGIRIYLAQHDDGHYCMVMVGVDAAGADLTGKDARYAQNSHDCPPYCFDASLGFPQAVVCQAVGGKARPCPGTVPASC